ncbi:hypothetical protein [Reichenbachiella ulvae]|uniref:Uncharacterized protein n=1 Tax=Reichenbachiella ulvae TaxID=2980104 RepID=A0ABT3CQU9_9BACT|nr:hypothetical protein [Reichenbachiella ulvae]MCV9385951.1 hypothetical protein [Reichenbachiella ulvae]
MRKGTDARQSRKVFSKLKSKYAEGIDLPSSNIKWVVDPPESFETHSYLPFYQTRDYRIIKYSAIALIGVLVLWSIFIDKHYRQFQQRQFEESGFAMLYQEDLTYFNQLFEYMESNSDKIISLQYQSHSNDFDLSLKHPDAEFNPNDFEQKIASFDGRWEGERLVNNDSIYLQALCLSSYGTTNYYPTNWIYRLHHVQMNQIPHSVINYLNLSNDILNGCIKSSKYQTNFYVDYEGITTPFKHPDFGYYRLIFSKYPPQSYQFKKRGEAYEVRVGQLTEGVYWTKEVKVEKSNS